MGRMAAGWVGVAALSSAAYACGGAPFMTYDLDASSGDDSTIGSSGGSSGGASSGSASGSGGGASSGSSSGTGSSASSGAGSSGSSGSSGSGGSGSGGHGSSSGSGSGGGSSGSSSGGSGSGASSSSGSSGGLDASTDASKGFACGPGLTCDPATTYCYHYISNIILLDGGSTGYTCQPLPACDATDLCSCVPGNTGVNSCSCSDKSGQVTDTCSCKVCATPLTDN